MSLITYRILNTLKGSAAPGRADHAPVNVSVSKLPGLARKAIASGSALLVHIAEAFAEARLHKALLEAELYRNRYMHTSKNDDDLPVVR